MERKIGRNYFQLKNKLKGFVNVLSKTAASFIRVAMLAQISMHGTSGYMGEEAVIMVFNILSSC
jgi:NADH:ubiquinone oxidoreductase subunit 4 (subunit M)